MRLDRRSIGVKLWLYFALFAAVILIILWFAQTVFLQTFYERMKTKNVIKAASSIVSAYGSEGFESAVDALTFRNAMLVFITDTQGNIVYISDEHGYGKSPKAPGATSRNEQFARQLPRDFDEFLGKLLSRNGKTDISYISISDYIPGRQGKILIYGAVLPEDKVLYISAPLEAVNATTDILRAQLFYVTVLSMLLSLVIAYFIARRFSKPVSAITREAALLAKGDYGVTFEKGFCSEIDELAATLDQTAVELSKAETLRRELLANISHDLRTPLTMIKAYTEMICDISGDNKRKREEHLAVISSETERLIALVNDILELSAIQADTNGLRLDNVDLSALTLKVISQFEPLAARAGYVIKTEIEPEQYVIADSKRLTQVLYNLIGNAVNYVGEDGTVSIRVRDTGGCVRFETTDAGDGISGEDLPYIWDRYYRAKKHKRPEMGTGLGLAIVKGILQSHGAQFGVESEVGKGSTFWFELKK